MESLSAKAKFGQNLKAEDFTQIMQDLRNRWDERDGETIALMQKFAMKQALSNKTSIARKI